MCDTTEIPNIIKHFLLGLRGMLISGKLSNKKSGLLVLSGKVGVRFLFPSPVILCCMLLRGINATPGYLAPPQYF